MGGNTNLLRLAVYTNVRGQHTDEYDAFRIAMNFMTRLRALFTKCSMCVINALRDMSKGLWSMYKHHN
jgi:hypothetical protein